MEYAASFILTVYFIHIFYRPAIRLGLVDVPGGRKQHDNNIPLIGGLGIFFGFTISCLLLDHSLLPYRALFVILTLLIITGVLDDLKDISARQKLIAQFLAAIILASWGGLAVNDLGDLIGIGTISLGSWKIPFTIVCVITMINAINMIDGVDGLAGSIVAIILLWLLIAASQTDHNYNIFMPGLLLSALAGFLVFNFPVARKKIPLVFMGDGGSMILGIMVAWVAIDFSSSGTDEGIPPIVIAWIVALPVFDVVSLMIRRILKKGNPMAADREHIHHIFIRAGFSPHQTTWILIITSALMGCIGVIGWLAGLKEWHLTLGFVLLFLFHMYFVIHAWQFMRKIKGLVNPN